MVFCIKELLLEGKNVKIDDLAIFSLGIKNKLTADSEDEFAVSKNIEGVKLRARATGELMTKSLKLDATLKRAKYINGKLATEGEDGGNDPSPSPNPSQGEGSNTGNGGGSDGGGNTGGGTDMD